MTSQTRARTRPWSTPAIAAGLAAAAALGCSGAVAQTDYELGRGLALGPTGLTLGGYLTAEYERLRDGRSRFRSSHASAFAWWEGLERLKVLAELDLENAVTDRRGPRIGGEHDEQRLTLQRLQADWTFDDAFALRVGKFLTPVGRWNLSHAGPLVWTTNRPLLTQSVYARQVTGVMGSGTVMVADLALGWSAYASNGQEWDADPRQDLFASVRGTRAVLQPAHGWQAGLSWARYEQRGSRGEPRQLLGADLLWARQGYEVQIEWLRTEARRPLPPGLRPGTGAARTQPRAEPTRGAYVQAVAPLGGQATRVSLVVRYERLRDTASPAAFRQSTLGLVWRPRPALSLKAEVQRTLGRPDLAAGGWTTSASVLF